MGALVAGCVAIGEVDKFPEDGCGSPGVRECMDWAKTGDQRVLGRLLINARGGGAARKRPLSQATRCVHLEKAGCVIERVVFEGVQLVDLWQVEDETDLASGVEDIELGT